MALDPKMKKAVYATIWTIFLGIACFVTVYAAASYLQWQQSIKQEVGYAVKDVMITNYSLPKGYVGFSEFSEQIPALNFTTLRAGMTLEITCLNTADLQTEYSILTLTLLNETGAPLPYILNLRNPGSKISFPLTYIDTYVLGYRFDYLPTQVSNENEILLNVAFELPP